ncbi:IclR family transcriptional regulator [Pseudogemmobacter bohemicus]|uniref:IclR family transcriptional regulator n=1 Tax=Pseudogemmobacter bohemicus TaxID=2250708 RepID=UPI0018E57271|nr:IclR family transcriptional regulator [Pseudogemmobacter bohemicus]
MRDGNEDSEKAGRDGAASRGGTIQAVEFALHILEFIVQAQASVGVSELARQFGTTKSRIYRHLQTLVSAGYLLRDADTERYGISARLMALGQAVGENFELASAARFIARDLRDQLGHAVTVSQREPGGMRVLLLIASRSDIEISVKPGSLLSLHGSAQGKVCLAFGDQLLLPRICDSALEKHTAYTILDPEQLRAEIEMVRRQGWAVAPNETMVGLNALSAPIFDALGSYVGAVTMVDSIQFLGPAPDQEHIAGIKTAAARISANLGYRGQPGGAP